MVKVSASVGFFSIALIVFSATVTRATATPAGVAHADLWPRTQSRGLIDPPTEQRITDLLARMSLEEKIGQMIQGAVFTITPDELREYPLGSVLIGGDNPPIGSDERGPPSAWLETTRAYHSVAIEERANHTPIPLLFGSDVVHGNNNVAGATLFPHNIGLGAAHDPDLIRRIGIASAEESAAVGFDWAFAPTLAVPQDDRWGRTYEGYSDDPQLVRSYATQIVLGLQGPSGTGHVLRNGSIAASAKHFIGDGATVLGTDQGDAQIDENELIRIHSQGYQAAIDAGVMTVMVSYSSWQGSKMHGNRSLITDVLKGRLGFEGFVIGDWNGHAQLPGCTRRNCPAAANAGVDMYMAPDGWKGLFNHLLAQARSGEIPQSRIDDAVRRILRVKLRVGLFDRERPWEGRFDVLQSAAHRVLAREAVRKSLVLLKNDNAVLPIRGNAHILVTGSGADNIGKQSGGWTLSWQGDGNRNSDFRHGESIYAGLRSAMNAAGGKAQLSADGSFSVKPDVAVVVFGEEPYAEYYGDLRTLEYQSGDRQDVALLSKFRRAGIPVVSIFLSGRPLWVNPELNASDAFVAAWLPGTEGGGIADLLIADAAGKARNDFAGKLSFSWPATAVQSTATESVLFARGFGLTYRDHQILATLSENSGVPPQSNQDHQYLIAGQPSLPWKLVLRARDSTDAEINKAQNVVVPTNGTAAIPGVISVHAADRDGRSNVARQIKWSGKQIGALAIVGAPIDLLRESNFRMAFVVDYRVDTAPTRALTLEMHCGPACKPSGVLDLAPMLRAAPVGQWTKAIVRLSCLRESGADLTRVSEPIVLQTKGRAQITLGDIRLEPALDLKTCPPDLHGQD